MSYVVKKAIHKEELYKFILPTAELEYKIKVRISLVTKFYVYAIGHGEENIYKCIEFSFTHQGGNLVGIHHANLDNSIEAIEHRLNYIPLYIQKKKLIISYRRFPIFQQAFAEIKLQKALGVL